MVSLINVAHVRIDDVKPASRGIVRHAEIVPAAVIELAAEVLQTEGLDPACDVRGFARRICVRLPLVIGFGWLGQCRRVVVRLDAT